MKKQKLHENLRRHAMPTARNPNPHDLFHYIRSVLAAQKSRDFSMRKALYGKPKAESRVFETYKKEKSTAHDDRRQKRCVSVFAFISLFSPQFLAARRSLPFQSNTPHGQECLTMRRIPLYNTLRVIKWWRRGESNSCPKTHPHSFLRA